MTPAERHAALVALGSTLEGRDLGCYAEFGRDPSVPILGEGDPDARIAIFGRDPGREEVRHGLPFVGQGGQKVRTGLHRVLYGSDPPDFDAGIEAGRYVFWANMVPFKPFENKAWSKAVQRAFFPYIADLLATGWRGSDVICLGEGAFKWFGLAGGRALHDSLLEHWARDDRYESLLAIPFGGRTVRLHPLPHPSPLNATWAPLFPRLLDARLRGLELSRDGWRRDA